MDPYTPASVRSSSNLIASLLKGLAALVAVLCGVGLAVFGVLYSVAVLELAHEDGVTIILDWGLLLLTAAVIFLIASGLFMISVVVNSLRQQHA